MFSLKKLKFVKELRNIKPRLKWLMFSQVQDYKINSNYIEMICTDENKKPNEDNQKLEAMVREMLVKEFTPEIKNMKSYELLVEAVVHNLKKKQNAVIED